MYLAVLIRLSLAQGLEQLLFQWRTVVRPVPLEVPFELSAAGWVMDGHFHGQEVTIAFEALAR